MGYALQKVSDISDVRNYLTKVKNDEKKQNDLLIEKFKEIATIIENIESSSKNTKEKATNVEHKEKLGNKQKGDKASPLKTLEEISATIKYYKDKANDARNGYEQLADRNALLLTVGYNVGIRASDLTKIKWSNVYDVKGNFLEPDDDDVDTRRSAQIVEQKTQKIKNLIFSDVVRNTIEEYVTKYEIDKTSDDYVFFSRQASDDGENHLGVQQCAKIVKEACKACGINRRVASHTLRKTFALWQMRAHQDDAMFTSELMDLLNHDSEETTLHYVGLDVERRIQYHNDVQLGIDSVLRNHKKIEVNHDKEVIVYKSDLQYLFKQLSEKCYTCNGDCAVCHNSELAKKYGYDLNTI